MIVKTVSFNQIYLVYLIYSLWLVIDKEQQGRIVKSSATLSRRKLQMDSSSLRPYVVGDLNP